jgi:probable F420-dependent oxidoreductase
MKSMTRSGRAVSVAIRRIGIHFPQAEIGSDRSVIKDYVQMAEQLGFDHINVPDHVLQTRTPRAGFPAAARYTTEFPHHEVMTMLGFMAGFTETLILKSAVLILPQRQAVLVAKQAAELDVLSGGRLHLGVGLGWNDPEYQALDMDFSNRAARMEEQIEVCRALWSQQHVTFNGKWHQIEDAGVAPMPVSSKIPIWIGAFARPAIERAARIADGWQAMLPKPDEQARQIFSGFKEAVSAAGRDADDVGVEASIFSAEDDPEEWRSEAQKWFDVGATQIIFRPQGDFEHIRRTTERFGGLLRELRS